MNQNYQRRQQDILDSQLAALSRAGPAQFSYAPVKGRRQEFVWRLDGLDIVYATPSEMQIWVVGTGVKPILPIDATNGDIECLEDTIKRAR